MSQPGVRTLAWILCLAACDAGAKPEPPASKPTPVKPSEAAKAPVASGDFDLAYLPGDTDVAVHFDMATLRKSKLWPSYSADVRKVAAPEFAGCDYDPLSQVSSVDVGLQLKSDLNITVFRGIDRDKAMACFHQQKAAFDGEFVTVTGKKLGTVRVLTFVDAHTMVVQGTKQPTKQTLQAALEAGAKAPLRKDTSFVAVLARTKHGAGVTVVSRPGSEGAASQMKNAGIHLSFFYASVDLTDRLSAQYGMDVGSADEAKQLVTMMKGQLESGQVKQMFDQIGSSSDGVTVKVELAMGETKLASLAGMLRGMLPES